MRHVIKIIEDDSVIVHLAVIPKRLMKKNRWRWDPEDIPDIFEECRLQVTKFFAAREGVDPSPREIERAAEGTGVLYAEVRWPSGALRIGELYYYGGEIRKPFPKRQDYETLSLSPDVFSTSVVAIREREK